MCVETSDILKLRPSVAVVIQKEYTEFFLTDTREAVMVKMQPKVAECLFELDGTTTLNCWFEKKGFSQEKANQLMKLLTYLNSKSILMNIDEIYNEDYHRYPRVFTLLEDFYPSHSTVIQAFNRLTTSVVMIVGLGSVGTWVAQSLLMSGVKHFIFVDADTVDISNLHRQCGFKEKNIGEKKVKSFTNHLLEMDNSVEIQCIEDWLTEDFFDKYSFEKLDLIVNCADQPSVDFTSMVVGEYAMKYSIPHIIGGGYNLHQSLVGQVVIPGQTACLECFKMQLDKLNEIDTSNIRKLENKNRKVGSFAPLSALSSSITANEAFKVLAGIKQLSMANNRTEFNIRELNFSNIEMKRQTDCKWCGHEGKYNKL